MGKSMMMLHIMLGHYSVEDDTPLEYVKQENDKVITS